MVPMGRLETQRKAWVRTAGQGDSGAEFSFKSPLCHPAVMGLYLHSPLLGAVAPGLWTLQRAHTCPASLWLSGGAACWADRSRRAWLQTAGSGHRLE